MRIETINFATKTYSIGQQVQTIIVEYRALLFRYFGDISKALL